MRTKPRGALDFELVDLDPEGDGWVEEMRGLCKVGRVRTLEDVADLAVVLARGVAEGHIDAKRCRETRLCVELAYSAVAAGRPHDPKNAQTIVNILNGLKQAPMITVDAPFEESGPASATLVSPPLAAPAPEPVAMRGRAE